MKDPFTRLAILMPLAITLFFYSALFASAYGTTSAYWIVKACLYLTFWILALYPNYSWSNMSTWRKIVISIVCLRFCFYFLPIEIILSEGFLRLEQILELILIVALLRDNNDGGGGKTRRVEPEDKKRDSKLATDSI